MAGKQSVQGPCDRTVGVFTGGHLVSPMGFRVHRRDPSDNAQSFEQQVLPLMRSETLLVGQKEKIEPSSRYAIQHSSEYYDSRHERMKHTSQDSSAPAQYFGLRHEIRSSMVPLPDSGDVQLQPDFQTQLSFRLSPTQAQERCRLLAEEHNTLLQEFSLLQKEQIAQGAGTPNLPEANQQAELEEMIHLLLNATGSESSSNGLLVDGETFGLDATEMQETQEHSLRLAQERRSLLRQQRLLEEERNQLKMQQQATGADHD